MKYIVELKKVIMTKVVVEAQSDEEADNLLLQGKYDNKFERVVTEDTYFGNEYISHTICNDDELICTEEDLKRALGCNDINNYCFKYTECGCCYSSRQGGIMVCGYAEGSGDAECPSHNLDFPFTLEQFNTALQLADDEGCELWDMCHDEDGNEIDLEF